MAWQREGGVRGLYGVLRQNQAEEANEWPSIFRSTAATLCGFPRGAAIKKKYGCKTSNNLNLI
jgi:hypothetical protein